MSNTKRRSDVDDLFDQLYPEEAKQKLQQEQQQQQKRGTTKKTAVDDFDDDDDDDDTEGGHHHHQKQKQQQPHQKQFSSPTNTTTMPTISTTVPFPSASSDLYRKLIAHHSCTHAAVAFVTSAPSTHPQAAPCQPPSLEVLRTIQRSCEVPSSGSGNNGNVGNGRGSSSNDNNTNTATNSPAMIAILLAKKPDAALTALCASKGAFHVAAPHLGNGCLDYSGLHHQHHNHHHDHHHDDYSNDHSNNTNKHLRHRQHCASSPIPLLTAGGAYGGCPFIVCTKCDLPVVRLQGARWQGSRPGDVAATTSGGGSGNNSCGGIDLYLVVRNYYPDWARLSTAFARVRSTSARGSTATTPKGAAAAAAAATTSSSSSKKDAPSDGSTSTKSTTGGQNGAPTATARTAIDDFDASSEEEGDTKTNHRGTSSSPPPSSSHHRPTNGKAATGTTATGAPFTTSVNGGRSSPPPPSTSSTTTIITSPTGGDGALVPALIDDKTSAAYCCQCSWLSVCDTPRGVGITATRSDVMLLRQQNSAEVFATSVIAGDVVDTARSELAEPRRLPLWVCKGHMV